MPVAVSVAVVSVMYELLKLTEKLLISKGISMEELEENWGDQSPLFLCLLAAGARSRAPVFLLYHTSGNLSREKCGKSCTNIFPAICAFCHLYLRSGCAIL